MESFDSYVTCLKLESMRRSTGLSIPADSLPTLKNIFDRNRKIQMSGLD